MARNENRRKKKLESRRRRSGEKKKAIARRESSGTMFLLQNAQNWPIIHSSVTHPDKTQGMLTARIVRRSPDGDFFVAMFLVDLWCLGVKDALVHGGNRSMWAHHQEMMQNGPRLLDVPPAYVRKVVQGAVRYAESLGLQPHPDYRIATLLLRGIDVTECPVEFEYGNNGRPMFANGPGDSRQRIATVINTLSTTVGADHFDFACVDRFEDHSDDLLEEYEFEDESNDELSADDEPEVLRVTNRLAG